MFDRKRLCIKPLSERKSKTSYYPVTYFALKLSDQEAELIDEIVADIKEKKKVILGFGAHFIKNKCQHHLWEIMTTDYITHIVTNGASTIHDFEFAVEAQKLLGISLEGSVG